MNDEALELLREIFVRHSHRDPDLQGQPHAGHNRRMFWDNFQHAVKEIQALLAQPKAAPQPPVDDLTQQQANTRLTVEPASAAPDSGRPEITPFLRKLFDKATASLDGMDYPDRFNAGLIAVYDYGRRRALPLREREGMVDVLRADLELAVDYFQDRNAGDWEVVRRWRAILLAAAPSAGREER